MLVVHLKILVELGKNNTGYNKAKMQHLRGTGKSIFELSPKS